MEAILCPKGHPVGVSVTESRTVEYDQTDDRWTQIEEETCTERNMVVYCPVGCAVTPEIEQRAIASLKNSPLFEEPD